MKRESRFNKYLELQDIDQLKELCVSKGKPVKFKKGDFLVKKGFPTDIFGFIESGAVKYTCNTSAGEDKVVGFSFSNDFISDLPAFLQLFSSSQPIALTDAQAIMDCNVYVVRFEDLSIFEHTLIKDITNAFFMDMYNRLLSMYCDTPEERYIKLVEKHPDVLTIATLRDIASFINITPETLSRIRRRITLP